MKILYIIIIALLFIGCTNLTVAPKDQEKRIYEMETRIVRLEVMAEVNHSGTITKLIPLVEIKTRTGLKAAIRPKNITALFESGKQCVIYFLSSKLPISSNDCSELYKLLDIKRLSDI